MGIVGSILLNKLDLTGNLQKKNKVVNQARREAHPSMGTYNKPIHTYGIYTYNIVYKKRDDGIG